MDTNTAPYKLIVVEGIDGVGKSTLVRDLVAELNRTSRAVRFEDIPFANPTNPLKKGVEEGDQEISFFTYVLSTLYKDRATRAQLQHSHVVADRYIYSVFAHHLSRGVDAWVINLHRLNILQPDFAFLLTAEEHERRRRIEARGVKDAKDRRVNEPGSELFRIEQAFKQLIGYQLDTTHLTPGQVLDRVREHMPDVF